MGRRDRLQQVLRRYVIFSEFDADTVIAKAGGFLKAMGFELNTKKQKAVSCHRRQEVTWIVVKPEAPAIERVPEAAAAGAFVLRAFLDFVLIWKQFMMIPDFCPFWRSRNPEVQDVAAGKINHILYVNPEDAWF